MFLGCAFTGWGHDAGTTMAFLTLEDLVGVLEIIVFPRDYEKYKKYFRFKYWYEKWKFIQYNTIGEYTGGRTEEELKLLEYDPAKKAITEGSKNEAKIGLDLEERGIISRLERSSDPKAEFIDISNGKKYDVKSFESNPIGANGIPITSPRKGAFKVENDMKNIIKEFEKNGNDIDNILIVQKNILKQAAQYVKQNVTVL